MPKTEVEWGLGAFFTKEKVSMEQPPFLSESLMKQMEKRHYSFSEEIQCILKDDLKTEEEVKEKRMEQDFREVLG